MELVNKEVKINIRFSDTEIAAIRKAAEYLGSIKCSNDPEIPCSQCPLFIVGYQGGMGKCIYVYLASLAENQEWSYIDEYQEVPGMDKPITETIDKNLKLKLFRTIIKDYGVGAAYGAGMTMTIDRSFVDRYGVFRYVGCVMTQETIAPYWKNLIKEEWDFDYSNGYVQTELKKAKEDPNV